jgi:tetratricopeptide (TPR) repeat protein
MSCRRLSLLLFLTISYTGMGQEPAPAPTPSPAPAPSPSPDPGSRDTRMPGRERDLNSQPGQDMRNTMPEMQRSFFLSGKVVLQDGTPPPEPVVIERVCNGRPIPEGYTDTKGNFSFELGRNRAIVNDAAYSSDDDDPLGSRSGSGFGTQRSNGGGIGRGRSQEMALMGCELRASLPGFRSEAISLSGRRALDNPNVGTIIMRRMANVEGLTMSASTLKAPKDARKAWEKGRKALEKNKIDEAKQELEKATGLYPEFAAAWTDLGRVQAATNQPDAARASYQKAIGIDAKFVNPWLELTGLNARSGNWEQLKVSSGEALRLNPFDFPGVWFLHAVANYNLKNFEAAESAAQKGMEAENWQRYPKLAQIHGLLLADREDFAGAAAALKTYLKIAPNAPDAVKMKEQLTVIEGRMTSSIKP